MFNLCALCWLRVTGAMIGSIICFQVGDFLGRRRELLIASVLFLCGSLVESIAGSSMWSGDWGLVILMIGRVSYGIGCGFAMHGVRKKLNRIIIATLLLTFRSRLFVSSCRKSH